MNDLSELIRQLDAEDLEQARRMTGEQKLLAGAELFDAACIWTIAGIRNDHPSWTDDLVLTELRRRLAQSRRDEEHVL